GRGDLSGGGHVAGAGAAVGEHGGVGKQMVRCGGGDRGGDDVTGTDVAIEVALRGEVHEASVAGAAGPAAGRLAAFGLGEQLHLGADELRVLLTGDALLEREETLAAVVDDRLGDLV